MRGKKISAHTNTVHYSVVGNLGRVDYITETEYDIFIRPDTCNPRFRVWFNFTVENVKADQRVIFNVVNFSKTKSLYRDGMTPLVKSTSRPKWYVHSLFSYLLF